MFDPFHDTERFSVTRYPQGRTHLNDYAVIDKSHEHRVYSWHTSRVAAHKHADALNAQHRAEKASA